MVIGSMNMLQDKRREELASIRETVESIWIAILVALVLRAFMFEAFVIPTGSMATLLMGRHWRLTCPSCGYEYAYGVSRMLPNRRSHLPARSTPVGADCPSCGHTYSGPQVPIDSGDRVFVLKYLYRLMEPQPWDVVVFRNPQNNRENYIKRLIGLPGESIEIVHGDIFVNKGADPNGWRIRRKPRRAQEAMWQIVFDNDYRPKPDLPGQGGPPPRWDYDSDPHWDLARPDGRVFKFDGHSAGGTLRFVARRGTFKPMSGYNPDQGDNGPIDGNVDVCADLKLSATFIPRDRQALLALGLTSLDRRFRAEFGADGTVSLLVAGDAAEPVWRDLGDGPRQLGPLEIGRGYNVAISHADFRVTLWLDGDALLQSSDEQYDASYRTLKQRVARAASAPIPTPRVTISARSGRLELRHVKLMRDVYYTMQGLADISPGPLGDYARRLKSLNHLPPGRRQIRRFDPGWGVTDHKITLRRFEDDPELDEFFVLGDNSPQSLDGRGWTSAAPTLRLYKDGDRNEPLYQLGTVPRYNMMGKALFVYWPAGFRIPGLPGLSLLPNVGRMRLIR